ncbi:MAG: Gfo/Idh/MocA family oxidoreductase [Chloroflexi bacterium]|nr:Gfo/Idh/MocA family oxidoreductase [Chloroflexota bacterium]
MATGSRETYGWGIVGCGVIAPNHAKAVQANTPRAKLVGVCDVVPEKAEALKNQFGAEFATSDLDALLARDDIDVISVCTPSGLHSAVTVAAAQAGKHVLSEKPLDITREKMDAAIKATREAGVKLGCVFQRRTSRFNQQIRQMVQEGAFGRILLADLSGKDYRSPAYYTTGDWRGTISLDRGCLMNQGVHAMDLYIWLVGQPVVEVAGFWDHLARDIEAEDTIVGTLRFANGALGSVLFATSLSRRNLPSHIGIHGTEGNVIIGGAEPLVERNGEKVDLAGLIAPRGQGAIAAADPNAPPQGHEFHVKDLIEAIDQNRDPFITGESARTAIDVILALYEASDTRRVVRLQ